MFLKSSFNPLLNNTTSSIFDRESISVASISEKPSNAWKGLLKSCAMIEKNLSLAMLSDLSFSLVFVK